MLTGKMRNLKQILIWLKRFRYRCGYGVHSPFAFDFITNVIYEKAPYYAYREIENKAFDTSAVGAEKNSKHDRKINRLLFRLVNRVQPRVIVEAGKPGITSAYLKAAKKTAAYIVLTQENEADLSLGLQPDFLYINFPENPAFVERIFEYGVERIENHSMFVVRGIYHSSAMKSLWKRLIADERVGITFDLYDLGILLFDKSKIKQHYIVNF